MSKYIDTEETVTDLIETYKRATEPGDLISRKQAIAEMRLAFGAKPAVHAQALDIINSLPSAEKKGIWAKKEYVVNGRLIPNYVCSQCGYWSRGDYYYCPNCGAKMEVE